MCFEFEWLYWAQLAQEREREESEKTRQAGEASAKPASAPQRHEQPDPVHA